MNDTANLFDRAVSRQKAGDLDAAEELYRNILATDPRHADALHMLGVIAFQRNRYDTSIKLITQAIRLNPRGAALYVNLGTVYYTLKQTDAAIDAFEKALSINPSMALAHNNLANACCDKGLKEQAIDSYRKAIEIDPTFPDAYVNLGSLYHERGDIDEAREYFGRALKFDPEHPSARHMLASLTNEKTESAPPEHVRKLFDEYAQRFDTHLTGDLGYTMPERIRDEILLARDTQTSFENVIDLGCGTGLAGKAFRSFSQRITGIDLSPRMIEQARLRQVYDALRAGDILGYLTSSNENYDLFICADVFPYIGNIYPLFEAVQERASRNAWFSFSTETTAGQDYVLRNTGRYAHSPAYIREAAAKTGFSLIAIHEENLRKQSGQWIRGDLVILKTAEER